MLFHDRQPHILLHKSWVFTPTERNLQVYVENISCRLMCKIVLEYVNIQKFQHSSLYNSMIQYPMHNSQMQPQNWAKSLEIETRFLCINKCLCSEQVCTQTNKQISTELCHKYSILWSENGPIRSQNQNRQLQTFHVSEVCQILLKSTLKQYYEICS